MFITLITTLIGMAIQASVTGILLKTGAIKDVTPGQQFLIAIAFLILAILFGIIDSM